MIGGEIIDKKVYIKGIVYHEGEFGELNSKDSTIDGISKMCIQTVEDLFSEVKEIERDVPIFFGSAYSSLKSLHDFNRVSEKQGALYVNPSLFPNTVLNAPSCRTSIYHKITSPIYNICNGDSSACDALKLAYYYLASGSIKNAVVCTAEENSFIANQIEQTQIINSCGALYLTLDPCEHEIKSIKISDKSTNEKKRVQSTELFRTMWDCMVRSQEKLNNIIHNTQQYQVEIQIKKNA